MATLNIILTVILTLCSIVLIAVVLMQQTKSGGLGEAFGGDTQSFSSRGKAASRDRKLSKITIVMAGIIALFAIVLMILQ
jgi:preprotein translocase subunit SecG